MESYRTVRGPAEASFTEKKSEFIGFVTPCRTWEEAQALIAGARRKRPDANHHVWVFLNREGNIQRFDDDGEPKGTGGIPILEVLKKEELCGVLVVVTRYFGGVLLGAAGLARAYARAARDAVAAAGVCRFSKAYQVKVRLPYPLFSKMEFECGKRKWRLAEKEFGDEVTLSLILTPAEREACAAFVRDLSGGRIVPETEGETFAEERDDL